MSFTTRLDSLMKNRDITIGKLSRATGISKSSLHGYQNGAEPSITNVIKLAEFFNTSVDYLVRGIELSENEELAKVKIHDGMYQVTVMKIIKEEK
jgi:transcriptional regulator with XRE-family HTH domain